MYRVLDRDPIILGIQNEGLLNQVPTFFLKGAALHWALCPWVLCPSVLDMNGGLDAIRTVAWLRFYDEDLAFIKTSWLTSEN